MAHFYGTLKGQRGRATRCGTKASGITVEAAGWGGCIRVEVTAGLAQDWYHVYLTPWKNSGGESRLIAEGPLRSQPAA